MSSVYLYFAAFLVLVVGNTSAFSSVGQTTRRTIRLSSVSNTGSQEGEHAGSGRREVLKGAMTAVAAVAAPVLLLSGPANAAEEQRCEAVDPRCGADGVLRDTRPKGQPIPRVTNRITHVVQLVIDVGERREEVGPLRFGLYGDDCPKTVRTMLEFLTPIGITGMVTEDLLENSIGIQTSSVSILNGGVVPEICPGTAIEFGIPSQKKAYARARGLREAGANFVPQNRPESVSLETEPSARKHDVAGLISVPEKGIGWSSGNGDVDVAYANSFLVTADANPDFDTNAKLRRRVIGQVIDDESMAFLARLSSLPVQKKGPGGKGPPLLKVTVLDSGVQKVGASNQKNNKKK